MAASKTTKKRKRKPAAKQQPVGNRFQTEILILVMFAACLILMISAFGMGGIVGMPSVPYALASWDFVHIFSQSCFLPELRS